MARPLLGAVNAAVGVVASAAGLAIVPIDRAATLRAGLTGIVYSLPELAFVDIRKGTFRTSRRMTTPRRPEPTTDWRGDD